MTRYLLACLDAARLFEGLGALWHGDWLWAVGDLASGGYVTLVAWKDWLVPRW